MTEVYFCEFFTAIKHVLHIGDLRCIEILHSRDTGEVFHEAEPIAARRGPCVSKGWVEDNTCDTAKSVPCRRAVFYLVKAENKAFPMAWPAVPLVVIIESERQSFVR